MIKITMTWEESYGNEDCDEYEKETFETMKHKDALLEILSDYSSAEWANIADGADIKVELVKEKNGD